MSYFSIKDFVKAGEESLKEENYWSALSVALALPSMCSRIEFENDKDTYMNFKWVDKQDKSKEKIYTSWKDKECYVDFCNQIMRVNKSYSNQEGEPDGYLVMTLGKNFAEVLYQLRCGFVHEGDIEFCANNKEIYFSLGEMGTNTEFENKRTIRIKDLCEEIFYYVKEWCHECPYTAFKNVYVFDMDNSEDDREKYKELCIKAQRRGEK